MQNTDATLAASFLKQVFGPVEGLVYLSSLPNEDARDREPGEKHVMTRDATTVARFVERWDRTDRGLFFCVSTLRAGAPRRAKDTLSELGLVHADIDFKSIEIGMDEVLARLRQLPHQPSIIIASGNGLHLYWLLKEAVEFPDDMARIELVLRQVADLVGGDLFVAEVARLMRLPGTHNTKTVEARAVRLIYADYEAFHLLEDLEEMLSYMSPIVARKIIDAAPGAARSERLQDNPYLAAAARLGFAPPIDVQRRLEAMSYQGAGDTCVHQTQVSVSAALLNRGEATDVVVSTVMDATRAAAGGFGENWNWLREERAVRRMCDDWLRKNPPAPAAQATAQPRMITGGAAAVVRLEDHRPKPKTRTGKTPLHVVVGTAVLEALEQCDERLLVTEGQVWRYADALWSSPTLEGRRWLEVTIEKACRGLGLDSTAKIVSETRQWMLRHPDLYVNDVEWDAHGKIPTRSGLVDHRTLAVEPARPEHRATWRIECAFDPVAVCPWWVRMLQDCFADRSSALRGETIATIQELGGLALIERKSKALSKALILQGVQDSGKTSLLEVLSGLFPAPISMPLDAIGGTHGLMEFSRRAPWVLHEAFNQSQWHFSSIVKSILTGDPVQINVKNGPIITKRINVPVFWGTNYPPQFKESTRAIVNRIVVIPCRQSFKDKEPIGVAAEAFRRGLDEPSQLVLSLEMPGVLNWLIAGLNQALTRGHLALTDEQLATRDEIHADSNLVSGFMNECVEWDEGAMIATPDFCAAFDTWWREIKGSDRYPPKGEAIGKALGSLGDDRVVAMRDMHRRYYCGVKLNEYGLGFWNSARMGDVAGTKKTGMSATDADVWRTLPKKWGEKPEITRMKTAHDRSDDRSMTGRAVKPDPSCKEPFF